MVYRKKNKGFTLVELLVVVAIIATLSVIGLIIFTGAQANARDARRRMDIDAIARVIETARVPATVSYLSLPAAGFSTGVVPVDSTTAKYCIRTSTAVTALGLPTAWAADSPCPTLPVAVAGESAWTSIPSTGLAAGRGTQPFVANTISWRVCARLETNVFYCKPSSQ